MKVKISEIIDTIEMNSDETNSYLNLESGKIVHIGNREFNDASEDNDISDEPDWYKESVLVAKNFIKNKKKFILLPTKFDIHEYKIMEKFVVSITNEKQKFEMYNLIKGKGAFSSFRKGLEKFNLQDNWYEYRDSEFIQFAEEWCQANNISYEK